MCHRLPKVSVFRNHNYKDETTTTIKTSKPSAYSFFWVFPFTASICST